MRQEAPQPLDLHAGALVAHQVVVTATVTTQAESDQGAARRRRRLHPHRRRHRRDYCCECCQLATTCLPLVPHHHAHRASHLYLRDHHATATRTHTWTSVGTTSRPSWRCVGHLAPACRGTPAALLASESQGTAPLLPSYEPRLLLARACASQRTPALRGRRAGGRHTSTQRGVKRDTSETGTTLVYLPSQSSTTHTTPVSFTFKHLAGGRRGQQHCRDAPFALSTIESAGSSLYDNRAGTGGTVPGTRELPAQDPPAMQGRRRCVHSNNVARFQCSRCVFGCRRLRVGTI